MQSNARGMHKSVSSMRLPVFSTCLFVCLYLCVHIFPRPEYFVQTSLPQHDPLSSCWTCFEVIKLVTFQ